MGAKLSERAVKIICILVKITSREVFLRVVGILTIFFTLNEEQK